MSIQPAWQHTLDFFPSVPVVVQAVDAQLSSDAGLLPIRQFDQQIGFTDALAAAIHDPRDPNLTEHTVLEMTRSRLYGILAGYADQNDHDTLRSDPVFKLVAERLPTADDLASQPTLSRFENFVDIPSLGRLRDVFIDQFLASFATPPRHLLFDLDAVDDPAYGEQQLVLFHGYYGQHQYLPLIVSSADTDPLVMVGLRMGTAHAAQGADDDLEYLVGRLRAVWPDVPITVRGDCGFGVPTMYAICERLHLRYSFGLSSNAVLHRQSEALLTRAVAQYEQSAEAQRLFDGFWYQAGGWPHPRWVVVKAEANEHGTNRRYIVTNRPGATILPEAAYDEHVQRGESENRNKELKNGLCGDRLSDHRFLANYFRLYLHAAALNLLVRVRTAVAEPPPVVPDAPVPLEALCGAERRQQQNQRRRRDPLGEGQPETWRTHLIKVAAEVIVSSRRVLVRLAGHWPFLDLYQEVCRKVSGAAPAAPPLPP